jgi:ABC-type sugar transport system permease subunit
MYLEIILTLILIVLLLFPTLIILWWFKVGKKAFKNISSFKNNTNLNSSENPFSGLANMAKMMESFKQFNRK